MSFAGVALETLGLYAGLFGGAMVLLYLLRVRRRTVYVPFSPLWSRVLDQQRARSLFRRLQRPGSLALQLLLVALLVVALGDPRPGGGEGGGCRYTPPPEAETSARLILIDTSASMTAVHAGRSRLEEAILLAREAATNALSTEGGRVMIATFDSAAAPLTSWTTDSAVVGSALDKLAESGAREVGTVPDVAVAFARDATRDLPNAKTTVVSDFAFDGGLDAPEHTYISVGEAGDNLGFEAFNLRPMPDDPLTYIAWYAVRNDSAQAAKARVFIYAAPNGANKADFTEGTRLVHSETLTIAAGATQTGKIDTLKFEGDRVMARVALDQADAARDVFPADDTAFAVVPERRRLRVQLVTAGNTFLSAALGLRENIAVTTRTPAEYAGQAGFDITVLDGVAAKDAPGSRLVQIAPPDLTQRDEVLEVETRVLAKRHALLKGVNVVDWNIAAMPTFETHRGDEIIITSPTKAPVLWIRTEEDGTKRVIISFDLKKSLLPMNLAFPLLIVNALNVLADEADGVQFPLSTSHVQGVPLPFDAGRVTVDRPDGTSEDAPVINGAARFDLSHVGLYTIHGPANADGSAGPQHVVAVNLMAPAESKLTPQPPQHDEIADATPTAAAAPEEEPSSPLWQWLIIIAMGVVIVEQLSWHRRWTV